MITNGVSNMRSPKLYRPVTIKFSSLRNGVGGGLGVIFDIDTMVTRRAVRVLTDNGWKWQIKDLKILNTYDYYSAEDQYILDNTDINDITVIN